MPSDVQKAMAEKICHRFFETIKIPAGAIIAGYWPIRGEVDALPILHQLLRLKHRCVLPRVIAPDMPLAFHLWDDITPMVAGEYSIMEPAFGEERTPNIVIVPIAAFDKNCHRLGYGGGYYDRTLAELKSKAPVLAIGLAYESQLCDDLVVEKNDVRMDLIITDKNVYQ